MHLLVLGANSEIALATARVFASREAGTSTLASRDMEALVPRAKDLEIRNEVQAEAVFFDALDYASHRAFYEALDPRPDLVLLAFGHLGDQYRAQENFSEARNILETNLVGAVSILEIAARDMEIKGRGGIIAIASPAGLRGRQSNYLYGAAKGGLYVYLSGLRHRLHPAGVKVLTVVPGFVNTRMTEGLDLPPRLTAEPEQVGQDIYRAWKRGRSVVYSRWFWRYIMWIIRALPEPVFMRTKL